jgi:hypothetical protein
MGLERLKEALEANDWDGGDDFEGEIDLDDLDGDEDDGEGSVGFEIDPAEMEAEMAGMKQAIYGGGLDKEDENDNEGEDEEVEKLQAMMLKMQAVRGKWLTLMDAVD